MVSCARWGCPPMRASNLSAPLPRCDRILKDDPMKKDDSYERGRAMRFDMFGEPGVRSLDNADDFNAPLQDLVTRMCFGDVWSRPGLDRKTRSMLTIAILVGQSRPDQLRNHINGALANGVTKDEIR